MKALVANLVLVFNLSIFGSVTQELRTDLILVIGAPGEPHYEAIFQETARDWQTACEKAGRGYVIIESREGSSTQLDRFRASVLALPPGHEELWIVLIGHGTFDGKEASFNLHGPDLSTAGAAELANQAARPLVFINTSASSAPFLPVLSHSNRIVVTATKSGWEESFARFGSFLAKAIGSLEFDLDKDEQVSLLEAWLGAGRRTEEFYKNEGRLSTEHALLDDNGDGKGTPVNFYRGLRPIKQAQLSVEMDGFRAHQLHFVPNPAEAALDVATRKRRNELEAALRQLKAEKAALSETEYLQRIEPVLLEISRLYESNSSAARVPDSSKQ